MKRKVALLFGCVILLSLTGCTKVVDVVSEKVASVANESMVESIRESVEESIQNSLEENEEGTSANPDEETDVEETAENSANPSDETSGKDENAEAETETVDHTESEAGTEATGNTEVGGNVEKEAKHQYLYYDQLLNEKELDLNPKKGKFFDFNGEGFPVKDANGKYFGYEDNLTPGCSVWCAVLDYQYSVEATSTLAPQGKNTYVPENILEPNIDAGWVEGVDGDGIGESITIHATFDTTQESEYYDTIFFPSVCIVNGLAKSEKAWNNNGRVKKLKMYFNDEYICDLQLLDTRKPQYISFSKLHLSAKENEVSDFRFEIAEVYPGDKYDDTALTGIVVEMFTQNH